MLTYKVFDKRKGAPTKNNGCEEDDNKSGGHQNFSHLNIYWRRCFGNNAHLFIEFKVKGECIGDGASRIQTYWIEEFVIEWHLSPENHMITIILLVIWWPLRI